MNNSIEEILILPSKFSCNICGKSYSRKTSMDRHVLMCTMITTSKHVKKANEEEITDLPNHTQLVLIVQELALKCSKLEEQMGQMQKWIDKKKKKINIIEWLNTHSNPNITFISWYQNIIVNESHFIYLTNNTIIQTIQEILEYNLSLSSENNHSIKCFNQKNNIFYVCIQTEKIEWKQLSTEELIIMLKKIQKNLLTELTKWRNEKQEELKKDDKLSDLYNKTVIKLMSVPFGQDAALSKIKSSLFNYLKVDLKAILEYEFEF